MFCRYKMLVSEGTVVTIVYDLDNKDKQIVMPLYEDMDADGDPKTHALYIPIGELIVTYSTYDIYVVKSMPYLDIYHVPVSGSEKYTISTVFIPSRIPFSNSVEETLRSYSREGTLIDIESNTLYSMHMRPDIGPVEPLVIPGFLGDVTFSRGIIDIAEPDLTHVKDIIMLYDYGFVFSPVIHIEVSDILYLFKNTDLIWRLPTTFLEYGEIQDKLREIKSISNSSMEGTSKHNELFYLAEHSLGWFFSPSGYHHYFRGKRGTYNWLYEYDRVEIPILTTLTPMLLSMCKPVIPESIGIGLNPKIFDTSGYKMLYSDSSRITKELRPIEYNPDPVLTKILRSVNNRGVRVIAAGGFVITKGDVDLFVLGGSTSVGKSLLRAIQEEEGLQDAVVKGSVITVGKYQIILGTDLRSILDVLYSFDFSHVMIAYDGTKFHITPEFRTFTAAGLSLMFAPMIRQDRLEKVLKAGLLPVYQHSSYRIHTPYTKIDARPGIKVPILEAIEVSEPAPFLRVLNIYHDQTLHWPEEQGSITAKYTIGAYVPITSLGPKTIFLNKNGISVGVYHPVYSQQYYVEEDSHGHVHVIRPVSTLS